MTSIKPSLTNLQKASQEISKSKTPQERIEALTKAFELFSLETHNLEVAYDALQKQFKTVSLELEKSNQQLHNKVFQLDVVTRYLHSILTNISQGIVFVDLSGIITTYNPAAEAILGVDHAAALFSNFWKHFNDGLFGFSMREALSALKSPSSTFINTVTVKGVAKELEINVNFILNRENIDKAKSNEQNVQGIIVIIRDFTEIRRLQMLASRHDRLKELGEMAAKVAHEIRNPLGGIKGFASLLQRDLKNQPELEQMAAYIVEGTDHLNHLVTNVLNYSRPIIPTFEPADLVVLTEDLRQLILADDMLSPAVKILIETTQPSIFAQVDSQFIQSAFLNLMVNAVQAMPEGGILKIALEKNEEWAIVQFADTGIGISQENLEKIFSPFFTTKPQGNGFGLSEVHKVIQAHGGTIDVMSTLGKGTEFTVKLPLKQNFSLEKKGG